MKEYPAKPEASRRERTLEDARRALFYLGESHRLEILYLLAKHQHQFIVRTILPDVVQYMISGGATSLIDHHFLSANGRGKYRKFSVKPQTALADKLRAVANWFHDSENEIAVGEEFMLTQMPKILRVMCEENRFRMLEFLQHSGRQTNRECIPCEAPTSRDFHISQLRKIALITRSRNEYAMTPNRIVYAGLARIASVICGDEIK